MLPILGTFSLAALTAYSPFFEVTSADSMMMVNRDFLPQRQCMSGASGSGRKGRQLEIDMVQNEFEAHQLVLYVADFMNASVVQSVRVALTTPLASAAGAVIPPEDIDIVPLGFVKGGPCPFDAYDPSCPAETPLRCKLGDAANSTSRCVSSGVQSVQCVGCSSSQGMINFRPEYAYADPRAWWPWVLLDHIDTFDVRRGTAQPVLITVRTRAHTPPGTYTATVGITTAVHGHSSTSLTVRVHGVALPTQTSTLSFWCAQSTEAAPAFNHTVSPSRTPPVNLSAWSALLTAHRLPAATCIYEGVWPAYLGKTVTGQQPLPVSAAQAIKDLWAAGQRVMIIQTFTKCHAALNASGCDADERIDQMMAAATFLKAAGWPEEAMYVYILDEAHAHASVRNVTMRVKQLLPQARTVSTGDNAFPYSRSNWPPTCDDTCMDTAELGAGGILEFIDIFIPRLSTYANQTDEHLAAIRTSGPGRKVGWYTSGIPGGSYALSLAYVEYSPMRPRLLLGAAAWKFGVEAYLYFSLAGWTPYRQGLPWDPGAVSASLDLEYARYTNETYDGQAQIVVPGPLSSRYAGFMSTLQLEGVRDGIEDLELYHLLSRTVDAARAKGIDPSREAAALVVPDSLVSAMDQTFDPFARTFSEDPFALRAQRLAVIRALERLREKLSLAV